MPRLRYIEENEKTSHTHELIESAKRTGSPDHLMARCKSTTCLQPKDPQGVPCYLLIARQL